MRSELVAGRSLAARRCPVVWIALAPTGTERVASRCDSIVRHLGPGRS